MSMPVCGDRGSLLKMRRIPYELDRTPGIGCRNRNVIREGSDGRLDMRNFPVYALLVFFGEIDLAWGDLQRLRDVVFVRDVETHHFFGCRAIAHEDCQVSWLL
jgi:hypothetical protein